MKLSRRLLPGRDPGGALVRTRATIQKAQELLGSFRGPALRRRVADLPPHLHYTIRGALAEVHGAYLHASMADRQWYARFQRQVQAQVDAHSERAQRYERPVSTEVRLDDLIKIAS